MLVIVSNRQRPATMRMMERISMEHNPFVVYRYITLRTRSVLPGHDHSIKGWTAHRIDTANISLEMTLFA